jgi:hypothetical protein
VHSTNRRHQRTQRTRRTALWTACHILRDWET